MQKEKLSREEFLMMFREDVIRLSRYIPWFEDKCGDDVSQNYTDGDKMNHTLSFPVYDSILLSFLNDASTTVFMEQNYHYFYSKNRIQGFEDELRLIEKADIMHMDILQCILSRYVFGGMTKAYLWRDGVEHHIFLSVLKKARQIIEFWSQPLIIEDEISPDGEIMNSQETVAEDEGFSDDFIAQIMAEYEAEDAAKAAEAAEAPSEEVVAEEVTTEDEGFSDEFIAQIMAEYEAEDAAKAAEAVEMPVEEVMTEEVITEDEGLSDEFVAQIMAEYEAEDAAKAAEEAETEIEAEVEITEEEAEVETEAEVVEEEVEEVEAEVEITEEEAEAETEVEVVEEEVEAEVEAEVEITEEEAEAETEVEITEEVEAVEIEDLEEDILQEVDELSVEEEIVSE